MRKQNKQKNTFSLSGKTHAWLDTDIHFQSQSSDGQMQVILTSCHAAVAADVTGEVRGGNRQRDMRRERRGSSLFHIYAFSHLSPPSLRGQLDWMWQDVNVFTVNM